MSDETQRQNQADTEGQGGDGDNASLTLVESLMAERRKFEHWLTALEARRATTPDRVFTRVHADYHDRLDAVVEQLKEHTEGLRAELASLTLRLTSIEEEQQQRRDERVEAELRAHVGELSPEAWEQVARDADHSIEGLASKHTELERERVKTRELLSEAERPSPPRGAAAIAPPVAAAPVARPSAPAPVAPAPPQEQRRAAVPPNAPARSEPQVPTELPPQVIAAEARIVEAAAAAAASTERADADVTPPPTQRADASRLSGETKCTFDELAFLSSVVNTPAGPMDAAPTDRPDERARRDSFAQRAPDQGIVNLSSDPDATLNSGQGAARTAGSPLAMNVSGNIPIIIKDKSGETAKSLKCAECGAMNYPTEWYCERCGAELASL
jgi:hypothetical protein